MKSVIDLMAQSEIQTLDLSTILLMLTHSIVLGVIMAVVTQLLSKKLKTYMPVSLSVAPKKEVDPVNQILGASNILFLCVGLTGIMLLVNNNFIRAFAILSAIALVRFRVKLDNNSGLTSSLLFSLLVGMACGVQEVLFAWTMTGVYIALFGALVLTIKLSRSQSRTETLAKPTVEDLRPSLNEVSKV